MYSDTELKYDKIGMLWSLLFSDVYYYSIFEDAEVGSVVSSEINATDIDEGKNSHISYRLENILVSISLH